MLDLRSGAAIAVLGFLVAGAADAQSPTASPPPQIMASGQAEVRVMPDRATVSIGVQSRAVTAAEASATNGRKQKAVIDAIRAKGVPADQITTTGFNVQPEMRYGQNSPPVTTGYVVSNMVTVQLQRTELAGTVIDASVAAGANQIHSLSFSIANPDSARRVALGLAVGRAKGDAEAAARAAGGSLGGLLEMTVSEHEAPVFRGMSMLQAKVGESSDVPIEAGLQPVRAGVTGRWLFVPGGR